MTTNIYSFKFNEDKKRVEISLDLRNKENFVIYEYKNKLFTKIYESKNEVDAKNTYAYTILKIMEKNNKNYAK